MWYSGAGDHTGVGPYRQSELKHCMAATVKRHLEQAGRSVIRAKLIGWPKRGDVWFNDGIGDHSMTGKLMEDVVGAMNGNEEGTVGKTSEAWESSKMEPIRVREGHICATQRLRTGVCFLGLAYFKR